MKNVLFSFFFFIKYWPQAIPVEMFWGKKSQKTPHKTPKFLPLHVSVYFFLILLFLRLLPPV